MAAATKPPKERAMDDYGRYQVCLLLLTQLAYVPVAASMLATNFFQPSEAYCRVRRGADEGGGGGGGDGNSTGSLLQEAALLGEFRSLLVSWGVECCVEGGWLHTVASTSVMAGGLAGAFLAGWAADEWGRKPVTVACLCVVCVGNCLVCLVGAVSPHAAIPLLAALGLASGGYMVTNLVLLVESLQHARSRLLAVAVNGWSVSMAATAGLARVTGEWRAYHSAAAAIAAAMAVLLYLCSVESVRWLVAKNRLREAGAAALRIRLWNGGSHSLCDVDGSLGALRDDDPRGKALCVSSLPARSHTYSHLFRYASVRRPLLALAYCFTASAVVSFGFYFNIESLAGSRYANMSAMGLGKFCLGLIPFAASPLVGRRPIALVSVAVAAVAGGTVIAGFVLGVPRAHWLLTVLSLLAAAALDPAWKMNHLLSAELFPTSVRNMARGVCNVGARAGGVIAPIIVHFRTRHFLIPYVVFFLLLLGQFVVTWLWLPETRNRPLPEGIEEEQREQEREGMDRGEKEGHEGPASETVRLEEVC